jgi:hypothetical protein
MARGAPTGASAGSMTRHPTFRSTQFTGRYRVSGITKDASGPLPGVTVDLYSESRVWLDRTISDGTGAYSFNVGDNGGRFLVSYKEGGPEVAGTTIHNVQPVPV